MNRVAAYARYSSDNQRAASIDDQLRNCRRRTDVEDWPIVAVFADRAISGTDNSRPEYRAMLAAAEQGQFDILIVDDLSRLARDQVESERTIRKLEFRGIRIIAVSDGYDSQTKISTRKIQRTIKGLVNEMRLDELREQVHRGLTGQAEKRYWCGSRPYGYRLKPIVDSSQPDPYGQPARIGTVLEINDEQAVVVCEIFNRYADGASCRTIARELNDRGIPSPGSAWRRKIRRCSGWVGSALRDILRNPLYTGLVRWNVSLYVRNPDTGRRQRRHRPKEEWVAHRDELLRIVSDELFEKAQTRTHTRRNPDERLRSGGRPKYLLSGLLHCGVCDAHYVMHDSRSYCCAGHSGGACKNSIRVRRDRLEDVILGPLKEDLLAPERVTRMAREMQNHHCRQMRAMQTRAVQAPEEFEAINVRIGRLHERQRLGDPDMTSGELQTVIDRLFAERAKLEEQQPEAKDAAKLITLLPNAAELYRRQIALGLEGNPASALKARVVLRDLLGEIRLEPEPDGSLWAVYAFQPAALVKAAGTAGAG